MLMGELSVAVFARPALPKTLATSGIDFINLSCTCSIRFTSEFDTSGKVTGINKTEPSSNGGINSLPKLINKGMLISKATMLIPIVVFRHLIQVRINGSYTFSKTLLIGFELSGLNRPFINIDISTGAKVITNTASTIRINVLV